MVELDSNLHRVLKEEIHYLPLCPCVECQAERDRRSQGTSDPANTHVKRMSSNAAHILGFLPKRSPSGSLARELMNGEFSTG